MPKSTTKKVCLITGGAKRVGASIVEHLHNLGFEVIFTYNSSESEACVLSQRLPGVIGIALDLSDIGAIERFWKSLKRRVDILINNASIFLPDSIQAPLLRTDMENMVRVNFTAPSVMTQLFMKQKGHCVINLLDKWAETLPANFMTYSISKRALAEFTIYLNKNYQEKTKAYGILLGFLLHNPKRSIEFFTEHFTEYPSTTQDLLGVITSILSSSPPAPIDGMIDLTDRTWHS